MEVLNSIMQFNATPFRKELLIHVFSQQNTVSFKKVYWSSGKGIITLDSHHTPKTFKALKRQLKGAKQHFKQREVLMINLQEAHLAPQALIFSWRSGKIIKNRLQDSRKWNNYNKLILPEKKNSLYSLGIHLELSP